MNSQLTAFDLFAGCGGLSMGFRDAGISIKWANEYWDAAADTYSSVHLGTEIFKEDARELYKKVVHGDSRLPKPGEVDIIIGGPPCQGFSGYNRHRSPEDPRNSLLDTFLDFVDFLNPSLVVMENVPGLL